jgi:hypothetical protein
LRWCSRTSPAMMLRTKLRVHPAASGLTRTERLYLSVAGSLSTRDTIQWHTTACGSATRRRNVQTGFASERIISVPMGGDPTISYVLMSFDVRNRGKWANRQTSSSPDRAGLRAPAQDRQAKTLQYQQPDPRGSNGVAGQAIFRERRREEGPRSDNVVQQTLRIGVAAKVWFRSWGAL